MRMVSQQNGHWTQATISVDSAYQFEATDIDRDGHFNSWTVTPFTNMD